MKPLTPATPRAIIMVGIPGSGKSAFAERFSKTFQAPFINQRAIQFTTGISNDAAAKIANTMFDELVKTNRTIIYEGVTATKTSRAALIKRVTAAGYQPLIVWVQTESIEAKRRATRKKKDGPIMSEEDFDQSIRKFSPPTAQDKPVVISGKHTYASQLKIVLKRIAGEQRPNEAESTHMRSSRNIILR